MNVLTAQVLTPFVAPALAWAGVALVSVPVAIHLLSRWRRKPEPWGAMRFLLEAYRKQKQRMRFEQWLLLMLRCLIVVTLGLALARPMMIGALGNLLGGLDSRGRVVHIVIDDALSTHAPDGPDTTRFDRLVDKAQAVVDSLSTGDRATLWRSGRPAAAVIAEPTADRQALTQALEAMRPRYGRPDVASAMALIAKLQASGQSAPERSTTVLLSDFTRSARYTQQQTERGAQDFGHTGALVVTRPLAGLDNFQVQSVNARRRVVWINASTDPQIATQVRVARFSDDLPEATRSLVVDLIDAEGRSLSTVRRRVLFPAGQGVALVSVDLPVQASASKFDAQGGAVFTIRAHLESDTDGVAFDNQAHAAVELRRQMRVAVVDEPAGVTARDSTGLTPGQWVTLALSPQVLGPLEAVEVKQLTPSQLNDPTALESLDVVMLLRPDRMLNPVWRELKSFAEAGGLVWVFTPPNDGSAPWVSTMLDTFNPGWQIGLEPVVFDQEAVDNTLPWALSSEPIGADPLKRLSADWQALIRPVRIHRRLTLTAPGADAWVCLDPSTQAKRGDEPTPRQSILAHHTVGLGSLVLLSTSVDTRWTNLPTKPIFVPLIHETLRGVLGSRDRPGIVNAVAGDKPELGEAWAGLTGLDRLTVSGDLIPQAQNKPVDLPEWTVGESGVQLVDPVVTPGVYQATTDAGPRRLIVDADPRAGDMRQLDEEALTRWLDGVGDWRWLDDDNPGGSLQQAEEVADVGWVLLWILLGLVVLETIVARYMSHANAGSGRSLTGRLWRAGLHLRSGGKPVDSGRGRAA